MHATRAAVEEGVVPGGGVTLLYAGQALGGLNPENNDQKVGIEIVRRALQAPARQIFDNAGAEGSIIVGKLLEKGEANHGFDAQSGTYVDMVKAGIIDPTKVVRLALAGRRFDRRSARHDRGDGRGEAAAGCAGDARRRHGRHGRYGLLRPTGRRSRRMTDERRDAAVLAHDMIDVHGTEASTVARANARAAALAGQAAQAKSWIAVLGIIQQHQSLQAAARRPGQAVPLRPASHEAKG